MIAGTDCSTANACRLFSGLDVHRPGGCNVALFTRGVKPTWEDSQAHGKWVMLTDKRDTTTRLM